MARMPASIVSDFRVYDPFRSPDWRWRCAVGYLQNHGSTDEEQDRGILAAVRYLKAFDAARTLSQKAAVQRQYPSLTAALNLYDAPVAQTWELRARFLTDETDEQIAQATGLDLRVVDVFERLFFDVRRKGKVGGRDWIIGHIFTNFQPHADVPEPVVWLYWYQISLQMPPPIIESNATTSDIPYPVDPFQLETEFATAGNHVWVSWPPLPDDTGFLASVSSGGESPSSSAVLRRPRCLDCSASAAA